MSCCLGCRTFLSEREYAWVAASTGTGQSSEGHQPLGYCPAADREEVWQTLHALHSLYEVCFCLSETPPSLPFLPPPSSLAPRCQINMCSKHFVVSVMPVWMPKA